MHRLSTLLLRLFFKATSESTETAFTRLDLEDLINDPRTDSQEEIDKELFGKALNLKDIRVREAMVPRPEIEHLDIDYYFDAEGISIIEWAEKGEPLLPDQRFNIVLDFMRNADDPDSMRRIRVTGPKNRGVTSLQQDDVQC